MSESNEKSALKALVEMLPAENSAVLVSSPLSLKYLSGLEIESGLLLASKEARVLFVTQKDLERLRGEQTDITLTALTSSGQMLDILVKYGIKRVYVEAEKMTVAEFELVQKQLHYAKLDTSAALDNAILELRAVKTKRERDLIANAQKICDKAYERLLGSVRKGMTEQQIASMLGYFLMSFGSEGDLPPITVLSGDRTADLSLTPSDRKIAEGDLLVLEFGAKCGGYFTRMSRTCAVGEIPPKAENAYNAAFCAMQDGLKALRAGVGSKVADSVAKATLNAWGVDKYCTTPFAHGVGLELCEPPFLGRGAGASLKADAVLYTKCAVSVPGRYGVKIGDMAVLTDVGCNNLTKATKSLVHI